MTMPGKRATAESNRARRSRETGRPDTIRAFWRVGTMLGGQIARAPREAARLLVAALAKRAIPRFPVCFVRPG